MRLFLPGCGNTGTAGPDLPRGAYAKTAPADPDADPACVTQGERCNEFSPTPSAITIRPDNTRLARAKAFELRSKTCAMSASCFLCVHPVERSRPVSAGSWKSSAENLQYSSRKCFRWRLRRAPRRKFVPAFDYRNSRLIASTRCCATRKRAHNGPEPGV